MARITGLGAISSIGAGLDETWASLAAGRDGIRPIRRFDTAPFEPAPTGALGAMVPGFDERPDEDDGALAVELAVRAGREALEGARIAPSTPRDRIALVLGSSLARRGVFLQTITEAIADALDVRGVRLTVSTACASSTNAIGLAKELLDGGAADVALAGGVDTLTRDIYSGFHALGLLAKGKCTPFSGEPGTTLGEGAGMLVLERARDAAARGAPDWGEIAGWALSSDAHHVTSPDPNGGGVARALRWALADAGVAPEDVDYVNAHGTGTLANDGAEWRALEVTLGARAKEIPVSSTKSYLGHAQGAAGVLELVATLLATKHGVVLPTLRCTSRRARAPADPVAEARPRPASVRRAISTSSAFGGANAAVVLAAAGDPVAAVQRAKRDVYWTGAGAVGGFSPARATGGVAELLGAARARLVGRAPALDLEAFVGTADPRGLDRSAQLLVAAAASAVAEAGLALKGAARERTGLFVASARVSPESGDAFDASVAERGAGKASAAAFSRLVVNAAAGACARLLSVRGPTTTLVPGSGGVLFAIAHAAEWLATRTETDAIIAAGIDEVEPDAAARELEASVALVLAAGAPRHGAVRVAGVGLAPPRRGDAALELAARRAGVRDPRVERVEGAARAAVSGPGLALVHARARILAGEARHAAVVSDDSDSVAVAIVLSAVP